DVVTPGFQDRRSGNRVGESLASERQGNKSVDDRVHAPLARRRTTWPGLESSPIVPAPLERHFESLLLGRFHINGAMAIGSPQNERHARDRLMSVLLSGQPQMQS